MTEFETHTHFLSDQHITIKRFLDGMDVREIPWCLKCACPLCPVPMFTVPDGTFGYYKGMIEEKHAS